MATMSNMSKFSDEFKNNGLSAREVILEDGKVKKDIYISGLQRQIILFLQANKWEFIPDIRFYEDSISYSYITGYTYQNIGFSDETDMINVLEIVKSLQTFTIRGKKIVHGDLAPVNVIFNKDKKIIKLIDWDRVRLGSKYQDPANIFWLWINIGNPKKEMSVIKKQAETFKKIMNYTSKDMDKIKKHIFKQINIEVKANKLNEEYAQWCKDCKRWIRKEWKNIWLPTIAE